MHAKKKRNLLIFIFPMIITIFFLPVDLSYADWGDGEEDCANFHGISRQYARYISSPNITIDGIANESVWQRDDVYNYSVVVGSNNQSEYYFKTHLHVQWVYDDDYLYVLAGWNDDSFDLPVNQRDLFMLCWNINCTNYTVGMYLETDSMLTNEPGARVDNWLWARNQKTNNSGIFNFIDQSHDDQNWLPPEIGANRDPEGAMIFGNWDAFGSQYQLEIRRPLTTSQPDVDVQFDDFSNSTDGRYRFAYAVADITGGEAHAISWTHELDFSNSTDYEYLRALHELNNTQNNIPAFPLFWMGTIALITIVILRNLKKSKN